MNAPSEGNILITQMAPNHACHEFFQLPEPEEVEQAEITDALADVAARLKMRRD